MKTKIHKILAVGLTLMLLVSLTIGLAAVPAAAGTLEWDKANLPLAGVDGSYFRDTSITGLGPMAVAIDGTLYAYVDGLDYLVKSTDDGRTWSNLSKYVGTDVADIAVSTEDADVLWVASATVVYRTTNAGSTFTALTTATDQGATEVLSDIVALAAGYVNDDPHLFVASDRTTGGNDDVFVLAPSYGATWAARSIPINDGGIVYDVATAPDFNTAADPLLIAVASYDTDDDGTLELDEDVSVFYKFGGGGWSTAEGPAVLYDLLTAVNPPEASSDGLRYGVDVAFPDDFSSDATSGLLEFFVAIDDGQGTLDADGGVYRLVVDATFAPLRSGDFVSIDAAGQVGAASLVAGTYDGAVHRSTNNGVTWYTNKEAPSGDNDAFVALTTDFLESSEVYTIVDGGEQALSLSIDGGVTFNQISLIDTNIVLVNDIAFAGTDRYMAATSGGNDNLWRHDGSYWERVGNSSAIDLIQASPEYETDSTVFWADRTTPKIYRSSDGGQRFIAQSGAPTAITGWAVIDSSTIIAGGAATSYRSTNNGTTWATKPAGLSAAGNLIDFALSPDYVNDSTIIVGDTAGHVYRTTNGGITYVMVARGAPGTAGRVGATDGETYVAFDPNYAESGILFAATEDIDGNALAVERFDAEWDSIFDADSWYNGDATAGATGIVVSDDGTMYVSDSTGAGVLRTLNPLTAVTISTYLEWEAVARDIGGVSIDAPSTVPSLTLTGSNHLYGPGTGAANTWEYDDTLTGRVVATFPDDGASTGHTDYAILTWDALSGSTVYEYEVNTDSTFLGYEASASTSQVASTKVTSLTSGSTYYWRVRTQIGNRTYSRWSEARSFTLGLAAAEWHPFFDADNVAPKPGATGVPLKPTFQWNAASKATGYEFILADNAELATPIVSKTVDNPIYVSEKELAYSKTYYWAVKAVGAASTSGWANGAFYTMEKPVKAAEMSPIINVKPAEVNIPPPAPPKTVLPQPPTLVPVTLISPVYIWVIIGIGALLVIAVIVLIVRTRARS